MARYTGLFTVAVNVENILLIITEILDDCDCKIVYNQGDYLMARESKGQVSLAQLVTVEITFDTVTATSEKKRMMIIVRNEELPLKLDNHCRQIFILLTGLIAENPNWKVLDSIM
ncbi:MAG: hypothetical protein QNJ68_12445 [Microcoleaceae cyanobacterium MO_207.B10]|nr:hypothetical protein [Microcoleaceae cyanobacterium MO_207.B10]